MKILVCGASGFVGRHIIQSLQLAGHTVISGVRRPRQANDIAIDFCVDTESQAWLPRLENIDVVINAVGVLRDHPKQPMALLHEKAPLALFAACQQANIQRIVQISALGIEQGINTIYFQSRVAAETYLRTTCSIPSLILRPSLIYGPDGPSTRLFINLARMPVHFLPEGGYYQLQPVHIEDITGAIQQWLSNTSATSQTIACVGADSTTFKGLLASYRDQLGYKPAYCINLPSWLVEVGAKCGDAIPISPLYSDSLLMLRAGNMGNMIEFSELLNRTPRNFNKFLQDYN